MVYTEDRVSMIVHNSDSISTYPIYKIRFYIYLLNRLGYGHLAHVLRPSGMTHGRPPYSFPLSPGHVVPMVPDLISSPECLASELHPNVLDLPILAKVPSALPSLKLAHRVLLGSGRVQNDSD
jgi:hypothetical protein